MRSRAVSLVVSTALAIAFAACTPAAPAPTAAPPKPTEAPKPAAPAAPAASPAATTAPAAAPAAASPAPAAAAAPKADTKAVEDFYRGQTIRIIVGSAAGGGYDAYARAIARYMGKYIPGNPTVIVENMEGAASLRAANHVYKVAPKDGTTIGHIQGGLFLQQLFGLQGVEFDSLKWQVLGAPTTDKGLCVVTKQSGFKSITEAMNPGGRQLVVGGNAPGAATWDGPMRLKAALDLNIKVVDGYDGTAKIRLAMDQGELDGMCGWGFESVKATAWDRVQSGDYIPILQTTEEPLPELKDVPMALQLAKTDEARQLIRLGIIVPGKIIRPFVVAPEVPAERVQALRQAFESTMKDPQFIDETQKSKLDLAPISGQEVEKSIRDLFAMPENLKARLKQINEGKG